MKKAVMFLLCILLLLPSVANAGKTVFPKVSHSTQAPPKSTPQPERSKKVFPKVSHANSSVSPTPAASDSPSEAANNYLLEEPILTNTPERNQAPQPTEAPKTSANTDYKNVFYDNATTSVTLFDAESIQITWQGLVDTHTSGLDFRPDIYIENNSSESVSISPSNFYVNGILMSASNSGAITLEPGTRLMLSTRNSWNLSASDLIDVYGCDTIESFSFDLTIKQGSTTLADKMRVSLVTDIDIFELREQIHSSRASIQKVIL